MKIKNKSEQVVTAKVFKSGKLQKSEKVNAGKSHRFKFKWCAGCCGKDKTRTYELWSGAAMIASGTLDMNTRSVPTPGGGVPCDQNHQLTIEDSSEDFSFKEQSEHGGRTAIVVVKDEGA